MAAIESVTQVLNDETEGSIMRRLTLFLMVIALLTIGLSAPASAKKPPKPPPEPPSLGDYVVALPDAGDGCFFRLTYDIVGNGGRKNLEYNFTVTDPANSQGWWTYPGTLTSSVRKGKSSTVAFVIPTGEAFPPSHWNGEDRVVQVDWTVDLFVGKKNPEKVDTAAGSEAVNVPGTGADLPCTLVS